MDFSTDEGSADPKRLELFLFKRLNETLLKLTLNFVALHSF